MICEAIVVILRAKQLSPTSDPSTETHLPCRQSVLPGNETLHTREVLQFLPPILDMFLILSFTLLGHFLFGHNPDDPFFPKLEVAFVNLFLLLTAK
jgi:hypothetical protein